MAFKITTETAVAAGIRRIEAITGEAAIKYFEDQNQLLQQVNSLMKNPQELPKAVTQLQTENLSLKKELNELRKLKSQILAQEAKVEIQQRKGIAFLAKAVDLDAQATKDLAFELGKSEMTSFWYSALPKAINPSSAVIFPKNWSVKKPWTLEK